jgi:hypothetical protein
MEKKKKKGTNCQENNKRHERQEDPWEYLLINVGKSKKRDKETRD